MDKTKRQQIWTEVKKKYRLSEKHIQMAKELGLNPKKFGGLANHKQERWKTPLPQFIEELHDKRFKKTTVAGELNDEFAANKIEIQ